MYLASYDVSKNALAFFYSAQNCKTSLFLAYFYV